MHRTYLQQPISWWKGALLKVELDIFRSFFAHFRLSPDPVGEPLEKAGNIAFSHGLKWEGFKLPRAGCKNQTLEKLYHACHCMPVRSVFRYMFRPIMPVTAV
jgi:hypothetical protein